MGLTMVTGAASAEVKRITAVAKEVFMMNSLLSWVVWGIGFEIML